MYLIPICFLTDFFFLLFVRLKHPLFKWVWEIKIFVRWKEMSVLEESVSWCTKL